MAAMIAIFCIVDPAPITKSRSHALQQIILSRQLGISEPITIVRNGKPKIAHHDLKFSVSHTHHLFCLATHPWAEIGIDIELKNRIISDRVLNRGQTSLHRHIPNHQRVQTWTEFEANAKCAGTGVRFPIPKKQPYDTQSMEWQQAIISVAATQPISTTNIIIQNQNHTQEHIINWQSPTGIHNQIRPLPPIH